MTIDGYKRNHKPLRENQTKFHQGYYHIPQEYIHKYVGDPTQIIYRSSLERSWCVYCSVNPNILRWSSEPIAIKYYNPIKFLKAKQNAKKGLFEAEEARRKAISNYYVDFWCEVRNASGEVKKVFIEIKPHYQTIEPKPPKQNAPLREHKRFVRDAETYAVNIAKWKSAREYSEKMGCLFIVVTEKTLKNLRLTF